MKNNSINSNNLMEKIIKTNINKNKDSNANHKNNNNNNDDNSKKKKTIVKKNNK